MPPEVSERRYRKYYEHGHFGPPYFFLAREDVSGDFVGMATLFPTRLRISGELVPAVITGDFAVDADHRAFGPAIALQRACLSALADNNLRCAYGSPNRMSEPIIDRVGYADLGRLTRFVRVLRAGPLVNTYVRRRRLARVTSRFASVAVDPVLSVLSRERLHRRPASLSVEEPEVFDERFSGLWRAAWREHAVTTERNPEFLNWKYEKGAEQSGEGKYSIFALTDDAGEVVGYIVHRTKGDIRHVFDILSLPSRSVLNTLLSEFLLNARRDEMSAISVLYRGPTNLLTRRLRSFAFIARREEMGLRIWVEGDAPLAADPHESENWYLLAGDQDVV